MRSTIAKYCVLLVLVGIAPCGNVLALELPGDDEGSLSLTSDMEFLITDEALSAEQAWHSESRFRAIQTRYLDLGRTRDTVWLRGVLTNPEQTDRVARLDTGRQYIEWMKIYLVRNDAAQEPELIYTATSEDPFSARPIDDLMLLTDISFAPKETLGLLIAYRSVDTTWMPLRIGSARTIDNEHSSTVTIDWLLNGALLAMVVFALLMGPVIGWQLAGSFALYILTATAYVAHADGYTFRYLWPDTPGWHDAVRLCLILFMPVAALGFAQTLFDFSRFRWLTQLMRVLMVTAGCTAVCAPWVVQVPWLMTLAYLLVPFCALVQVTAGSMAIKSRQLGSVPYFFGAVFVCSSFIYAAIAHLQPGSWDVDYTLDYGHLALFGETLSFAIAIALRLRGLRHDASAAQSLARDRQQQLDALNHDIRQPLIALREGIAKLDHGDLQEQMTAAFHYLESLAEHGPIVDKANEPETFAASMMLDGIREMFEDEARKHGVTMEVKSANLSLQSDPIALMRIVSNLVANAIEHGGDHVELEISTTRPTVISVTDNGAGMDQQTLQQRLKNGDSGTGVDGRGLGLGIVQAMADSIGAVFTIESSPGQGTKARVELPEQA